MMNDADIETREFEIAATHSAKLRKKGICVHGWYTTQSGIMGMPCKCFDCGKLFATLDDLEDERKEFLI